MNAADRLRLGIGRSGNVKMPSGEKAAQSASFQAFFEDALSGNRSVEAEGIEYNFNHKNQKMVSEYEEQRLFAQVIKPQDVERVFEEVQRRQSRRGYGQEQGPETGFGSELSTKRLEITPFQMFIDKSIEVLESISAIEYRVNDLTEQYIQGKVSLDEVSVETMKLNLVVSFATTVLSSGTQAFKEITNLAI